MSSDSGYQPTSRRPIADVFRRTAHGCTDLCVRLGVHPNTVSLGSVVAAAGAGVCFWLGGAHPILLIPAALFCYLRLWMNMLDGMVALASGKASRWGEILNDLPDRVSDVLIFVGVAHSGLCQPFVAYWVAIAALLVAYVGTFGQAVGVQREFSGVMAKPWRMVALHIGAWVLLGDLWWGDGDGRIGGTGWTWIDLAHLVVLIGCVQTVWLRLVRILAALRARAG
ncbi:MAG: CDP-alcohol phosphatidyltransferase family protein [Planctomycetes bacterium]|nr:CDP-alcohol phosphatidyltransferase family protein [Planctomycetota bacterium]MCB9871794.1 CDP-alcohol phosphatidyltransferase family protein [Planctomycetota bacterium]MCB9889699.1 CDP-alcohol phosphatidyltransferase family protein [Planctomycetota bacterium]